MYSSYGSFKRLGLSTSSHIEPKMTKAEVCSRLQQTAAASQRNCAQQQYLMPLSLSLSPLSSSQWMNAFGTANNIRPAAAPRRPRAELPRPPQRTESSAAAVSQMVASARALRQRNESSGSVAQARPRQREAQASQAAGGEQEEEAVDWDSDNDDEDDGGSQPVQSGIQREARADRRVQQLRAQHRAEQGRQRRKLEKTRRTRTLRRSTSDVVLTAEAAETPPADADAAAVPLPSLGDAAVGDVRQRTRLLLREALITAEQQTRTSAAEKEKEEKQSEQSPAQKKRKREQYSEEKQSADASAVRSQLTGKPAGREESTAQKKAEKGAESELRGEEEEEEEEVEEEEEEEEDEHALLASDIEQHLFEHHRQSASTAYRQHSRSLIFALVHNVSLTASLLSLSLSPLQLITMPSQQLASHQRQQQREQEQQEMRRDLVLKGTEGYRSDEWQCEGCGGRETECWVLKETRDLRKVEVWGGGGDETHSLLLIRCCHCKRDWKREL